MAAIISRKQAFELTVDLAVSTMTSFLIDKKYPCPNRTHFLALYIFQVLARHSLMILGSKAAEALTKRAGYIDAHGKVTNSKYHHLKVPTLIFSSISLIVYYRMIAERFNLQLPNFLEISGRFSLNQGLTISVLNTIYAFSPTLAKLK